MDTRRVCLKNQTLLKKSYIIAYRDKILKPAIFWHRSNLFPQPFKKSVSGIQNVFQVDFHLLPWFYYSISNSPHQVVLVLLPQHELRYKVHPLDDLVSHPQLKRNTRISRSIQTILTVSLLYHLKLECHLISTLGTN